MKIGCRLLLLAIVAVWPTRAMPEDWPQFLGPKRNGTYSAQDLAIAWPKEGPRVLWKKSVGQGFSAPVVASGKLVLFHRLGDREVIECWEAAAGQSLWKFDYPALYRDDFGFDEGPRSTPAIDGAKIYSLGADGLLHCLDLASGRKIWSCDTKQQFSAAKGFFGFACSPLVERNAVLLNLGGRAAGTGIVAFDKETGKLLWQATDHEASYSSPVTATIAGSRQALFFTREGLVSLNPENGRIVFDFPWRSRSHASVNAATPLVIDDFVFISASYDTGAALLQVKNGRASKLWTSDEALSNHYATSVHRDGWLYGFHGRQESGPSFRCIELKTGKVRWNQDNIRAGTVTLAGDSLLLLLEDGRLLRIPATPEKFQVTDEAQILPAGVRAYPALAGGCLYARSKDTLVCINLRAEPSN